MKPEKEKWINDILGSSDSIQRTEPSPFLFTKIRHRLSTEQPNTYLSARVVWGIVASFILLLFLNWQVINQSVLSNTVEATDLKTIVSEMQLYPANNQPYGLWSTQNY